MVVFNKVDWSACIQPWFFSSLSGILGIIMQKVLCTKAVQYCVNTKQRKVWPGNATEQNLIWKRVEDETVPGDPELMGPVLVVTHRVFYLQVVKKEKGKWEWLLFAGYLINLTEHFQGVTLAELSAERWIWRGTRLWWLLAFCPGSKVRDRGGAERKLRAEKAGKWQ